MADKEREVKVEGEQELTEEELKKMLEEGNKKGLVKTLKKMGVTMKIILVILATGGLFGLFLLARFLLSHGKKDDVSEEELAEAEAPTEE